MSDTVQIPDDVRQKINDYAEDASCGFETAKHYLQKGYKLSQQQLEEKQKEIERLKELIYSRERSSHFTFYANVTSMTKQEIDKQFQKRWQQFKSENNI